MLIMYLLCSGRDYGMYKDPPGYFQHHVWPGYIRELDAVKTFNNITICKSYIANTHIQLSMCIIIIIMLLGMYIPCLVTFYLFT